MNREHLPTLAGRVVGEWLLLPPTLLWALNEVGVSLPWSWRTWIAVGFLASIFRRNTYEPRADKARG